MIQKSKLILSSNFSTYRILKEKNIKSHLWEDCYSNDDLLNLHHEFKIFCNTWFYDENGKDLSLYDGMSIGIATSNFIYYDLESWIRVLYLFEYLAKNKIETKFYVLKKNYFPKLIYKFIHTLNDSYTSNIKIISLEISDNYIEPSFKQLVSINRCTRQLEKKSQSLFFKFVVYIKNFLSSITKSQIKCLVLHTRNSEEYFENFLNNHQLKKKIQVYIDLHYFLRKKIIVKDFFYNMIYFIFNDNKNTYGDKYLVEELSNSTLSCVENSFKKNKILDKVGQKIFKKIILDYIPDLIHGQLSHYLYLKKIIKKYKINSTLCSGLDSPYSYYCKHLMELEGNSAFFLNHGIVEKNKSSIIGVNYLAHYFFEYSGSQLKIFSKNYEIPLENIYTVNFFDKVIVKEKKRQSINTLILYDNFQCGLNSRINIHKYFLNIYKVLRKNSIENIEIRFHGAFYNYYRLFELSEEDRESFFYSLPVQGRNRLSIKDIIGDYDLVIGPLTTCIYEAMLSKVFFIPYIESFFPSLELKKITQNFWFPELYPKVCRTKKELNNILVKYIASPEKENMKYLSSIKNVNLSQINSKQIWEKIMEKNNIKTTAKGKIISN